MKIENKEMLLYSMNRAYDELATVINDVNASEQEVYFRLGSCLHWLVDCYDRVKDIGIEDQDQKIFQAVRGANNAQKHVRQLYKLHRVSASGYPRRYSRHYGIKYLWEDMESVPLRNKNEKIAYQELFRGNNILNDLSKARSIINKYLERCD